MKVIGRMLDVSEREKFEITVEDRIEKMNKTIFYVLKINKGDNLLYETKDIYKEILEKKFSETNKIAAIIEFVKYLLCNRVKGILFF